MKKLILATILISAFLSTSCTRKMIIETEDEYRVMKTGDLMQMNTEEYLISNNTWNLETTDHYKFYFDLSISEELRNETIEAQERNYREIANLMGLEENTSSKILFYLFKDRVQKKLLTFVDSDAHAISTFPAVYYLPKNSTGGQEVGHVITQKNWGFIPKTSNYSLVIDEGFNFYVDDERFYNGELDNNTIVLLQANPQLTIESLVTANNGKKMEGVSSGAHKRYLSMIAGSFVKYLIEEYGVSKFEELWKMAVKDQHADYEIFEKVYNINLTQMSQKFDNKMKETFK